MKRIALLAALAATPLSFAPTLALGHEVEISGAYARATPPSAQVGVAFMTLRNTGPDATLVGGKTPAAKEVQLHSHTMDGGVMKMRRIDGGIPLREGESVTLEPGGLHVMLIGLDGPLVEGETISITLRFDQGHEKVIEVPVSSIAATGAPMPMDHGAHGHSETKKHAH